MQPEVGCLGRDFWYKRKGIVWLVALFGILSLSLLNRAANASAPLNGTLPLGGTLPPPPVITGQGQVRVIHLAPFAASTDDTEVDVCTENNNALPGLTGLVYGSHSGYQVFATGNHDWKVTQPGCGALVVDLPQFQLYANTALTIYIIGDGTNQPFAAFLSVDRPGANLVRYLPFLFHRQPVAQ
jgi:hypothetical protein